MKSRFLHFLMIFVVLITFSCKKDNNPPAIVDQIFSVKENSTPGLVCATIIASDPDGDHLTYKLSEENPIFPFEIDPSIGNLKIKSTANLDYEQIQQYKFQVKVTDGGQTSSAFITINIIDQLEVPNIIDQSFNINENLEGVYSIGIIKFVSKGQNEEFNFSISEGNNTNLFFVGEKSGELFISKGEKLDYESTKSYPLQIKVQNKSNTELYTIVSIGVNVVDVNEKPTINDQSFSISENSQNGTEIGSIKAFDVDAGQSLNYSIIQSSINNAVNIDAGTGKLSVSDKLKFDYEANNKIALTITVTDSGTDALSDTAMVTINILDVNENPVITTKKLQVDENSMKGNEVGKVIANSYSGGPMEYSILAGDGTGKFTIDKSTGIISVAQSGVLNFETKSSYSLTIKVNETNNPECSTNAAIAIDLNDVNEYPMISDQQLTVKDSEKVGAILGKILASDSDFGQTLSYSITEGNSDGYFAIDLLTGNVILAKSIILEANELNFVLSVQTQDNGVNQLSSEAKVTINVLKQTIPENGLIAYYPFNGNANDESINSYDGHVSGSIITNDRNENANSAFAFDGVDDYIDLGPKVGDGVRSISLWFKPDTDINGDNTRAIGLLARDGDYNNYSEFNLAIIPPGWGYPTGKLRFMYSKNKNEYYSVFSDDQNWSKGKWYHVVVVIDEREGMLMYINNMLQHNTGNYYYPTEHCFLSTYIGSWGVTPNWYFQGKVDDLVFYDRALNSSEVQILYQGGY